MRIFNTKLIGLWNRFERPMSLGALAVGFAFDLYIAKSPESIADNILLLSYLFIAAAIIILLHIHKTRNEAREHPAQPLVLLLMLQFCLGGLASNLLVLYGKSGTLGGSALFILLLAALLLGNEFFKSRYAQLLLAVAVYYFLLLTYCLIALPTFVFHSLGTKIFLISAATSLVPIGVLLAILYSAVLRGSKSASRRGQLLQMAGAVAGGLVMFNALYFFNVIPPAPLALKAVGVYHSVVEHEGTYTGEFEVPAWFVFWRDTAATYTIVPGQPAYCFSAVFAPGALQTTIVHRWEYFYPKTGHWITVSRVSFPLAGGREDGYRGFSQKQVLEPGQWRCDIETAEGQLIGRITFDMVAGPAPALSTSQL